MSRLLIITQKVDENDQLLGFFVDWLNLFAQKFEHVIVLCLESGIYTLPGNVEVISLGKDRGRSKAVWLWNFYKIILGRRSDYDSVFIHMNPIWAVLGGIVWRIMRKKTVLWYTHKAVTCKLWIAEKFVSTVATASSESFRLPSDKVIVTGHGIDTELFTPSSKLKNQNSKLLKILSVGRLAPVKNYEVLIGAAKILKEKNIVFSVTVVGEAAFKQDGEYEKRIRQKIRDLGLEGNFNFIGKVVNRNLPSQYQSHNIFVHMSKTGSLDKALLGAMAGGMVVLSSNDAARAFLPPERIFSEDDADELADKIQHPGADDFNPRDYVVKNHELTKLIQSLSTLLMLAP